MIPEFTKVDVKQQYALIGEFIVRFEDVNDWVRFLIPKIIFPSNRSELQSRNIDSLIENITADQLRTKFDSLLADNFPNCPRLSELNNKLSAKTVDLAKIRNTIVHGAYRLGWKDQEGNLSNNTLSIKHGKATKRGFEKRSRIISTEKLESLNADLFKVSKAYNYIAAVIDTLNNYQLPKQADKFIMFLEDEIKSIPKFKFEEIDILN